jgi:hypothetical protein
MRRSMLRLLKLLIFTLVVTFIGIEILLRVGFDYLPPRIQADIQSVRRVPWDEETIIPRIPFTMDRDFQVRLPVGMKDFPVRWSDARFEFSTIAIWEGHRAGLRSDSPRYPIDIMTFGDSFTFCWTGFDKCWVNILGQHYSVFNAGIPGTGMSGQLALMKEIVPPTKPRLVIWVWYNNDLSDNYDLAKMRNEVTELKSAPSADAELPPTGFAQFSALAQIIQANFFRPKPTNAYRHYQLVNAGNQQMLVHTNEYPYTTWLGWENVSDGWDRGIAAYEEAHQLAKGWNAQIVHVFIPTKEEAYISKLADTPGTNYINQMAESRLKLIAFCREQGWYCLDAEPALRAAVEAGQTVYYKFDSHLDDSGNAVLAKLVQDYLDEIGLLK